MLTRKEILKIRRSVGKVYNIFIWPKTHSIDVLILQQVKKYVKVLYIKHDIELEALSSDICSIDKIPVRYIMIAGIVPEPMLSDFLDRIKHSRNYALLSEEIINLIKGK
jgi:hypothetical protein